MDRIAEVVEIELKFSTAQRAHKFSPHTQKSQMITQESRTTESATINAATDADHLVWIYDFCVQLQ